MTFSDHFLTANEYYKGRFGRKVYKLPLAVAETCPNRDGTLGTGGCIFCSNGGSGEFAASAEAGAADAILAEKKLISGKLKRDEDPLYIAYFQSFTSTYARADLLEKRFTEAIMTEDVAALSVATRPDSLPEDTVSLLERLSRIKHVFVEFGLQTADDATASFLNRCCESALYKEKALELKARGIEVIMHMIAGLPRGETDARGIHLAEDTDCLRRTCELVAASGASGVKIQVLSVLSGTVLGDHYDKGKIKTLSLEEYGSLLCDIIGYIPEGVVIHRITGDPPKALLKAPLWTLDKKKVLNYLSRVMDQRGVKQGSCLHT